jgi:hypothetical protein
LILVLRAAKQAGGVDGAGLEIAISALTPQARDRRRQIDIVGATAQQSRRLRVANRQVYSLPLVDRRMRDQS